jgi:hypothetical protein
MLTIPARATSGTIRVPVVGDKVSEPDEYFNVQLSSPTNAILSSAHTGKGTILNDDNSLSINNVTQHEGTSGTTPFTFTVTLSQAATFVVTVQYKTVDGTAKVADGDYTAVNGTLTFQPGQTSQQVTVMVNGDSDSESSETLSVHLFGSANAIIAHGTGIGTILDGSAKPAVPSQPPGGPIAGRPLGPRFRSAVAGPSPAGLLSSDSKATDPGATAASVAIRPLRTSSPALDDTGTWPAGRLDELIDLVAHEHSSTRRRPV